MPRAAIARQYGGIESIELVDEPHREPADDEVVIAVKAAGVNPADAKAVRGVFGTDPTRLPLRLGSEVAGTVIAVGPSAQHVVVGAEVVAFGISGGFAEEVTVPADSVFPKPAALGWHEAAALLLAATTAWHLVEATGVGAADTVLIHGASGGVGSIAVQLCRLRGATVFGTASSPRLDAVRRLGATAVSSGEGLLQRLRSAVPGGFTVALDTVGTDETIRTSADLVVDRDRVAVIAGYALAAGFGMRRLGFGPGADPGVALRDAARGPLLELAGRGDLVVEVARSFPLNEVREALTLVAGGKAGGKLVLVP